MKKIILSGGGTAGHVNPNLALVKPLRENGCEIFYIGGRRGVERELVAAEGLPYYGISAGKLRRYLNLKNFTDVFRVLKGIIDALIIIRKLKPAVIFSKGGFVAVPVVVAGKLSGVPVIIHESDLTFGLANKLSAPFAKVICCAFPETLDLLPQKKSVLTGAPIRDELYGGVSQKGLDLCGFDGAKPVTLVMGGSLGSVKINQILRDALPELTRDFHVAHICGRGNADESISFDSYKQFEYVAGDLSHLFACASVVVSRAGANSISEFLALKKPALLIPLPLSSSRGDQIKNAESFKSHGFSETLPEEELDAEKLVKEIKKLYEGREKYIDNMNKNLSVNGTDAIVKIIVENTK